MKYRIKVLSILLLLVSIAVSQLQFVKELKPIPVHEDVQFCSITASKFGDIYLLEKKRHEIYRLDWTGKVLNINGGFGWEEGCFDTPIDLSIGSGLDVIVADYNNHRLVRFDRFLNFLTVFTFSDEETEISYPVSVAASKLGEIFILDEESDEVIRFDMQKNEVSKFGGAEYGEYTLFEPFHIRISKNDVITVLEKNGRLVQFDRFGTPIREILPPEDIEANGLVLINENFLILSQSEPKLLLYSNKLSEWFFPIIIGYEINTSFISGIVIKDSLLLLNESGAIAVCNFESLDY